MRCARACEACGAFACRYDARHRLDLLQYQEARCQRVDGRGSTVGHGFAQASGSRCRAEHRWSQAVGDAVDDVDAGGGCA